MVPDASLFQLQSDQLEIKLLECKRFLEGQPGSRRAVTLPSHSRSAANANTLDDNFAPVIHPANLLPSAVIADDYPWSDIDAWANYDGGMRAVPAAPILDHSVGAGGGRE
jgi:hypothetical protein